MITEFVSIENLVSFVVEHNAWFYPFTDRTDNNYETVFFYVDVNFNLMQ